jgi:hypothetical protein
MFFYRFSFHGFCGYAVTNLATSRPSSTIQIVRTLAALPVGDSICPTITYFWPCGDTVAFVTSAWRANFRNSSVNSSCSELRKPSDSKNAALRSRDHSFGVSRYSSNPVSPCICTEIRLDLVAQRVVNAETVFTKSCSHSACVIEQTISRSLQLQSPTGRRPL